MLGLQNLEVEWPVLNFVLADVTALSPYARGTREREECEEEN